MKLLAFIFEQPSYFCIQTKKTYVAMLVREPAILLIKWLRPKGLKVCSYEEKYAEFKNQPLKKSAGTQKCYAQRNTPGVGNSQISTEMGNPIQQNLI